MNKSLQIKLKSDNLLQLKKLATSMGSLPTLSLPKIFPTPLKTASINERNQARNSLMGAVITKPSKDELAIETVFYDKKDLQDNGDLYIVNFLKGVIDCYYRGQWGNYMARYGNQHRENKDYLRTKT